MFSTSTLAAGYASISTSLRVGGMDVDSYSEGTAAEQVLTFNSLDISVTMRPELLVSSRRDSYDIAVNLGWEWAKFQSLKGEWLKERSTRSSISQIAMCPAYQRIIAMGPVVVPYIFREMEYEGDQPDQWFWALQALTMADPVTDAIRGDFQLMASAWLTWGRDHGYAW